MTIEKIIMKKTLLGGGKVRYPTGKAYRPPFTDRFKKDILPMVKTFPKYFDVVYAKVEHDDGLDGNSGLTLQQEADRLNAEREQKKVSKKANK